MKVWLQKHDHPYNLVSKYLVNMEVRGVGMDGGGTRRGWGDLIVVLKELGVGLMGGEKKVWKGIMCR